MSRALEPDVISFLKTGDHSAAYKDISQALTPQGGSTYDSTDHPSLLEIEILGRSHPTPPGQTLLRDENAIGVPKLRLVQAFIVARQIVKSNKQAETPNYDEVCPATAVMLLMDAENLTAANTRKRILLSRIEGVNLGSNAPIQHQKVEALLQQEMWFVDSLLTSRLHRHTKSPTLWSHRRWLIEQHSRLGCAASIPGGFAIIKTAGERHPRNYYAWCHARWLLQTFKADLTKPDLESIQNTVHKWCMAHHNDISGWSMLAHIQVLIDDKSASLLVYRKVLSTTERYRWTNESIWWYLRTTAARLNITPEDRDLLKKAQLSLLNDSGDKPHNHLDHNVLDAAWQWYDRNRGKASNGIIGG